MTARPVVLIAEELAPSVLAVLGDGFDIRHVDGADRAALLPALADADAVLIRSATQVDEEALAAAPSPPFSSIRTTLLEFSTIVRSIPSRCQYPSARWSTIVAKDGNALR